MIKIIVDSSADCNLQDGIVDAIVPISVNIDGTEYKSGIDLTSDKFYELLQTAKEFPRTAQPSPQCFIDLFEQAQENGDQLIYLCLSYFSLHTEGEKSITIGNISSLPSSMSRERIIFESGEKNAKFSAGPTSPSPGPILLMHAATAEKVVSIDLPSSTDIAKNEAKKRNM